MDPTTLRLIQGAAGAASDPTYVDDVFSTFLYDGTYSAQSINNGIDLAGEGGLVWLKQRDVRTRGHYLTDTVRGNTKRLSTNDSEPEATGSDFITSFNNNGFSIGVTNNINQSGSAYASWSFRKAPGFFTCVQYTGTGVNRTVAHDLESIPGMMIVKCTNTAGTNWLVYHTSLGPTKAEILDLTTGPVGPSANYWNNTAPTSTEFTVGASNDVNTDGDTYIAYLFANDEPVFGTDADESIIKCGSLTTNAGGTLDAPIDLGFEPQFILTKNNGGQWYIFDTMRGVGASDTTCNTLKPNSIDEEQNRVAGSFVITSTGFTISTFSLFNTDTTVPYMAIRFPNKPPTAATDVFSPTTYTGNATARLVGATTNLCDLAIISDLDANTTGWPTYGQYVITRLTSGYALASATSAAQTGGWGDYYGFDENKGLSLGGLPGYMNNSGTDFVLYNFTRAPGFMDVVAFDTVGASTVTVNHNLGAVPEFFVVKKTSFTGSWECYHKDLGNTKYLNLNTDAQEVISSTRWNNTTPTATQFTLGSEFQSTRSYIAYLFATVPGISKVGSYTGTSATVNVDCGFSAGARFILIKRSDSTGDWYVYDTARGIISGNDPYILLNTTAAQVINTDYIDPLASGFTVTSSAPVGLNADGGTYIFLAIA